MRLLFVSDYDDPEAWRRALLDRLPDLTIEIGPAPADPAAVDVALAYKPPAGLLRGLPNLKAVLSLAAGVDHLRGAAAPAATVPVARLVDPAFAHMMASYVLAAVLRHHRDFDRYARQQADGVWRFHPPRASRFRRVGILGLGPLGIEAARLLRAAGFPVAGWSRSAKAIDDLPSFAGADGFTALLRRSDILVCLLPLTAETTGLLDARAFAAMPAGAALVNVGRGGHVVDADLLAALDQGRLAGATLDVFHDEPPAADHPFWRHPRVLMTPHVAAYPDPETAADAIADNLRRLAAGQALADAQLL
jgi:glyoxylate/hydroxypyruvate reductase A